MLTVRGLVAEMGLELAVGGDVADQLGGRADDALAAPLDDWIGNGDGREQGLCVRMQRPLVERVDRRLLDEAVAARELVPCDTRRLARAVDAVAGGSLIGWAVYHWRFGHRHRVRFGMKTGLAGLASLATIGGRIDIATARGLKFPLDLPAGDLDTLGVYAPVLTHWVDDRWLAHALDKACDYHLKQMFGLPIFFDAGLVVFLPIIFSVAKRFGGSVLMYALPSAGAFAAMHAIVPPHPGPVGAFVQRLCARMITEDLDDRSRWSAPINDDPLGHFLRSLNA
mgnify:CR=1 FL=1